MTKRISEKRLCIVMLKFVYIEDVWTHREEYSKLDFIFPDDTNGKKYIKIFYKGYKYKISLCGKRENHFWKVKAHGHKSYTVEYVENGFDKVVESIMEYHKKFIGKVREVRKKKNMIRKLILWIARDKLICINMFSILYIEEILLHFDEYYNLGFIFPKDPHRNNYIYVWYKDYKYKICLCSKKKKHFIKITPYKRKPYMLEFKANEFNEVIKSIMEYHKNFIEKS